ncbi:MAG: NAD-dependent epimerase/dehydratase family protein [Candidatus Pacebacteria bacterium]|nr:NAD-dependent epimerase/dehydratase family protein [Candidatus Paceibacterota bacterium]
MGEKLTIFITGGAGYVGEMLAEQFAERKDVREIILLDKEPVNPEIKANRKIFCIQGNTSDGKWQKIVRAKNPDIVIHCAWQIREMYGDQKTQWKWNVEGSKDVFDFAFSVPSVKKLIYFSTVASYGAFKDNTLEHKFVEDEPFRESKYLYAEEKRVVEENLRKQYDDAVKKGVKVPQVFIIRPAAITGPKGKYARIRFGLQSVLSGTLRSQKSLLYSLLSALVSWVPVTPKWLRQYVHEDDITDMVEFFCFNNVDGEYEIFNAAPPGAPVYGTDMARAVGKRTLPVTPSLVATAFFFTWHLTRGRIPTSPGRWRGYSYPIHVDGLKITKKYGYNYKYESWQAFVNDTGRYQHVVPQKS